MDGSPSSVLTEGFGSWGSVGLVVTLGFGIFVSSDTPAEAPASWAVPTSPGTWKVPATTGAWEPPTSPGRWEV
jgi:hypothetical protein